LIHQSTERALGFQVHVAACKVVLFVRVVLDVPEFGEPVVEPSGQFPPLVAHREEAVGAGLLLGEDVLTRVPPSSPSDGVSMLRSDVSIDCVPAERTRHGFSCLKTRPDDIK